MIFSNVTDPTAIPNTTTVETDWTTMLADRRNEESWYPSSPDFPDPARPDDGRQVLPSLHAAVSYNTAWQHRHLQN